MSGLRPKKHVRTYHINTAAVRSYSPRENPIAAIAPIEIRIVTSIGASLNANTFGKSLRTAPALEGNTPLFEKSPVPRGKSLAK